MEKVNEIRKSMLGLLFFLVGMNLGFAYDDVVEVKSIMAGDTYPDASVSPVHLISMEGVAPNPPIDLPNTTYGIAGWNCWHTSGNDNAKAWLLLDLGETLPVADLYIWNMNQYGNSDRDIKDIVVTCSADSQDGIDGTWTEIGQFVVPKGPGDGSACHAQLCVPVAKTLRYLRIQAKSSYGSIYWGLGKIMVTQDHSVTGDEDIVELKILYKKYNQYHAYEYTYSSWKRLDEACKAAKELIDEHSTDVEAIKIASVELENAASALIEKKNQMLGGTIVSSSCYGEGYEAANIADGKFNTRWASAGIMDTVSVMADLKEMMVFNQIAVFESEAYCGRVERISVQISDDGIKWNEWRTRRPKTFYTSIVGEVVKARYIRVVFHECSPEGINVDELMIFHDPSAVNSEEPIEWRAEQPGWVTQQPALEPNVYQVRKSHLKYGMFIHYGINTFLGQEWSDGSAPASAYNPDVTTLDPESWVKAAYEGGMNFVVLVAKHHDGFALWNTAVGTYNINYTGREGDKRDIVKEVAGACRKYGIKLGLYYSAWDRNWDANHTVASTGLDRVRLAQQYNDFALAQITELMDGRYGEISELWIDGAWVKTNAAWEFSRLYDTVKRLQPTCQMAINCTIRGVTPDQYKGGEELFYFPSDFRLQDPMFTRPGADADPKIYQHDGKEYYLPFEATICINNSWFWSDKNNTESVLSAEKIKEAYHHMSEQENTLVVNLAPGKDGRLNSFDVDGLYAGARSLGIARGDARKDIVGNECAVRVDYVTQEGYVAWPTCYVYGKSGESFTVQPVDLRSDGYRLVDGQGDFSGVFGRDEQVRFVYEDIGERGTSVSSVLSGQWLKFDNDVLVVSNAEDGILELYATDGRPFFMRELKAGVNQVKLTGYKGMYIVVLRDDNEVRVQKICLK